MGVVPQDLWVSCESIRNQQKHSSIHCVLCLIDHSTFDTNYFIDH